MTRLEFTDAQRRALPHQNDWDTRCARFRAFEDRAFETMKRCILAGDITPRAVAQVERHVMEILKQMPETQAEMVLYTDQIDLHIIGHNYRSGWWWRRYTSRKYLHLDITFGPYRSGVSAWTDPTAPGGIVRFQ